VVLRRARVCNGLNETSEGGIVRRSARTTRSLLLRVQDWTSAMGWRHGVDAWVGTLKELGCVADHMVHLEHLTVVGSLRGCARTKQAPSLVRTTLFLFSHSHNIHLRTSEQACVIRRAIAPLTSHNNAAVRFVCRRVRD